MYSKNKFRKLPTKYQTCTFHPFFYQGGTEKIFLYNVKEMNVSKIIEVPMFVSVVKLIYPEWIMCGHFDGNLSAWNFKTEEITPFKGHHADVLALDVNQV